MLKISNLVKQYHAADGAVLALDDVSFEVEQGEFLTLLGPSGCGKSTALRCIAGLEAPDSGQILIGGEPVFDSRTGTVVPPNRRDLSMVFQSYAIWPHMSVFENVAFPLRVKRAKPQEVREKTEHALKMVGLTEQHGRSATLLSGGQQQRVALARAIAKESDLLLLDEPLSNLDAELRTSMRRELRMLQEQLGITTIYVTHDQDEALSMSDRIALMRDGRVVEIGTPQDLYLRPSSTFAASFIGQAELIPGKVVQRNGDEVVAETALGRLDGIASASLKDADNVSVLIRPEHVVISSADAPSEATDSGTRFEGTVVHTQFSGKLQDAVVRISGSELKVQSLSRKLLSSGDRVRVFIPRERCVVLPALPLAGDSRVLAL